MLFFRMKPMNVRVGAKPGKLALGELSRFLFHLLERFNNGFCALQHHAYLTVTDAVQRF